ncbi:MAG: helix-hairpin-helix domain-containing protein [Bacteroidales bacterium]|jgi:DNA uptake protein ComE-like DNA-binding protein|nr:helix-hairpin-helix domain-containing protein [Bacteroidales bacterium]
MKINISPLRQWFGFTRQERRTSFILIVVITGVICTRWLIPGNSVSINYTPLEKQPAENTSTGNVYVEAAVITGKTLSGKRAGKPLPIEINSCDSADLLPLYGIGPVLSGRIIKYRNLLGGYASKEQLLEVYGLTPETFDIIKDRITADTLLVDKIDVNTAGFRRFGRLPYFERQEINDLLKYRSINGKIHGTGELVENNILSPDKANRVKPYLGFR